MEPLAILPRQPVNFETGGNGRGHLMVAAYELLKERLLEGRYRPGERISPDEVMGSIGASRQPVMDAVRRLAAEGFINVVPQVGCLVAKPEPRDIGDFLRMLAALEGTCLELACERATGEEIAFLGEIVRRFRCTLDAGADRARAARAFRLHNREFHHYLYAMAHSGIVFDLATSLSDRADFYINTSLGAHSFEARLEDALEEHRRIAEVVSWRDSQAGRRVIEAHILAFIDSLHGQQAGA